MIFEGEESGSQSEPEAPAKTEASAPAEASGSSTKEVTVPDIGDDEVEVTEIMVAVGDSVDEEQSILSVEGDKASMEVPAPFAGTVKEIKVAEGDKRFINLACINIVVAANAGGAFSPFGDITTLMVWQAGLIEFQEFFILFIPSLVNFLIPAMVMSLFIKDQKPSSVYEDVQLKRGARRIIALFLLTIGTAVLCHTLLNLPPVLGMMTGLGYLQFFGYYLRQSLPRSLERKRERYSRLGDNKKLEQLGGVVPFDVFNRVARAEWDTLLFFYGVVMCVGGLGFMGYLGLLSEALYTGWNATWANIALGVVSAVVDNIPV